MNTKDFSFELPPELIAQYPSNPRDHARLLTMNRKDQTLGHHRFYEIIDFLNPGDCLVLNDTRVLPARLLGVREDSGAPMEFLLLHRPSKDIWEVIVRPGRRAKAGHRFVFGDGALRAEVLEVKPDGNRIVQFFYDGVFETLLDRLGNMPLPPYITQQLEDREQYQTVYATHEGSAAAPTAGLHFTKELLQKIEAKGVSLAYLTLHVGLGTFRPVKVERIEDHPMHSEFYSISEQAAATIRQARERGGRIIAVGTTSVRTLESVAGEDGSLEATSGWTNIFIYPGYRFKIVDALITNFHLSESTLLMLVSAFAGREQVLDAYQTAIAQQYRFFSFGDAMFIV